MNNDKFHAKILNVKPNTVDEFGKVYDLDILVESKKGEIFWVHDTDLLCDKNMEGKIAKLEIHVWQSVEPKNMFELQRKEKKIVLPETSSSGKSPEYYPIFYGEIIKKLYDPDYNERFFYLDVGSGIIYIDVYEREYNDLKIGDFIKVLGNIIRLEEVDDKRMYE